MTRGVEDLLADLAEAAELVSLGKKRWDSERLLCLAGEAVIGHTITAADPLADNLRDALDRIHRSSGTQ